jgi:hypothetical protein
LQNLDYQGGGAMVEQSDSPNRALLAVRLGWLTVEAFGRLRRYRQSSRKVEKHQGDATRRFDFSDRELSEHSALLLAMDQLRRTAARLGPGLPSLPVPSHHELDHADLDTLQGALDDWSTEVWVALSTEDDAAGRGFTYGGSLADTCWHAGVLGPSGFGELLRPYRLEYIAHRFDGIADHVPPYTARVLHHTLYRWRDAYERLKALDSNGKKQVLARLESQAKVWHDLLFGGSRAESYLTTRDRRFITWGAVGATTILVIVAMILVWLAVLALSSAGRTVAASMIGLPQQLAEAEAAFVDDILDWQKWSALLATISSMVVLITGLVTRLSGWVTSFHNLFGEWLKLRRIYRRTYRDWRIQVEDQG